MLTQRQIEIINGHLLGDGTIEKRANNGSFKINRKLDDLLYLEWSFNELSQYITDAGITIHHVFDNRTNKTYNQCKFRTKCCSEITEIYDKWYVNGIKVVPKDLVLTPLTIAVWLADDGSIANQTPGALDIKFATHSFSLDEVLFLKEQLSKYGEIKHYKEKEKNQYTIRVTNTRASKSLLRDIDQIFPPLERKSNIWRNDRVDLYDTNKTPICLYCKSEKVYKNGHLRGEQRFRCLSCNSNFRLKDA